MFKVQNLKNDRYPKATLRIMVNRLFGFSPPLKGARGMFSVVEKIKHFSGRKAGIDTLRVPSLKKSYWYLLILGLCFSSCKENPPEKKEVEKTTGKDVKAVDSTSQKQIELQKSFRTFDKLADTTFVRLADFSDGFAYDLRYATKNNFLKEKVYDCAECYTRVKTVKALIAANEDFKKEDVRIKFFDCYRPNSVQYKMWEIVPNPQYVANPKKGSIHNKGGAVDITLETLDGKELDMGTDFDYFGKRAYHDNFDLPNEILDNRKLLKETMEKHGFWSTRTEWWHYNLSGASKDPIANFKWECN